MISFKRQSPPAGRGIQPVREACQRLPAGPHSTGFGLTRILGEMRTLGIKKISRQTIRNILKEAAIRRPIGIMIKKRPTWTHSHK